MNANFKPVFFAPLLLIIALATHAQDNAKPKPVKMPEIQAESLRAPDKVKIDGNVDEWGTWQAHNTDVRVFYTLANDDKNLYLVIRSQGPYPNDKMLLGGITLIVSHSLDKKKRIKAPDNVSVTFPVIDKQKVVSVNASSDKYFYNWAGEKRTGHQAQIDSLQAVANAQADAAFKEIRVIGIKDVDTVISMYNTDGIKAAARFDNNIVLNCEMAIPLKYLGLDPANPTAFSYAVRLNGTRSNRMTITSRGPVSPAMQDMIEQMQNRIITDPNQLYMIDPKDLWSVYTLAKK